MLLFKFQNRVPAKWKKYKKTQKIARGKFINIFLKHILFELFILDHYPQDNYFLSS